MIINIHQLLIYGISLGLALVFSLYGTPLAMAAAKKYNIVDRPDGRLKHQREPVPYLGGLSIYLSFLLALSFTFEFDRTVLGLILAGTIVMLLGLIDDFGVLTPKVKLTGQLIAILVLIKSGIHIQVAVLPAWAQLALTVFWLVGMTNAFNIIDVMDGLSSGVAIISATFLFVVAIANHHTMIAVMTITLIGSLLGFLWYNFHPAKIYMGDTGSLFIGLMLGALAMMGDYTAINRVGFIAPLFIFAVPIFDTVFVMYIRWLRGLPLFLGSNDHFALRLRKWAFNVPQTVVISYMAAGILGLLGLGIMYTSVVVSTTIAGVTVFIMLSIVYLLKRIDMTL